MNKKIVSRVISALMTVTVLLQTNSVNIYATNDTDNTKDITSYYSESSDKIKEEFSKNGNKVTQYVNDEEKKLKTIVWTKGIHTPPKMGGNDADFKKYITPAGSFKYVDYKAPFISGQGWYDVNKSEDRKADFNLCFAAASSNSLHWWMAQNSEYIDKYLQQNPNAPKAEEIKKLKNSFKNQQDSDIYKIFVRQFGYKKEGYWPDLLQDQFINGYYPKPNAATNDSPSAVENLISKGPDKNGGFFNDVFDTTLLTKRHYYYFGYDAIADDLKRYFLNGDIVLMTYTMGPISHVVTLWGAEFDTNGKISAVYFSDSDDDKFYGMQRYRVVNAGGRPGVTTRDDGKSSSYIESLGILSSGREIWEEKLNISKKQLQLVWGNNNFTYNGTSQKPSVTVENIQDGHDVRVSVNGEMTNVGTYTATAVLEGKDVDKYELPKQHTKEFTISKAQPNVILSANVNNDKTNRIVNLQVMVSGVNNHKLNGNITFKDGDTIIKNNVIVENGIANYSWDKAKAGNHNIVAEFIPATDEISKNYNNGISNTVNVNIEKLQQDKLSIKPVTDKKFGDEDFKLEVIGGSGNGAVRYSCDTNDVISINGDTVTILGVGTARITATKLGDENYNDATATYDITITKAKAPQIEYPTPSNIIYGQKLVDSNLNGGSTKYGTFSWKNENVVPTVDNNGYEIIFTPNENTLKNYEEIKTKTKAVEVKVTKANPKIKISSNVLNDKGIRKVQLIATIQKVENGANVTGTVRFVNSTDNKDIAIEVSIKDGVATYTWTGMENKLYDVKAVYSGDKNYNLSSSEEISVDATKKPQTNFKISEVGKKTYADKPFTLNTTGGNGIGLIMYKSSDESVLSIDGNTATIHKSGKVTITATKLGDEFYEDATATYDITIAKAKAPQIQYPTASNITYGQKLVDSNLNGGSTKYGTFSWKNENVVPTVDNNGYEVIFIPNENTLKNYEGIKTKTKAVEVKVSKANPKIKISSNVLNDKGIRKVQLTATIQNVENGANVTGTVRFVNSTDNKDIATEVSIKDGVATYTWTGMESKLYDVKAVYSGDKNYNLSSSEEISVDATKKPQTNFKISEVGKKTYADKPFTLNTTGGNGIGLIMYKSSDESVLSIDGNTATIHKSGKVTITATKLGDEFYDETNSSTTLVINKKVLTVTAENKLDIIKGSSMPTFTYKVDGLVNGDKLIVSPTITTKVKDTNKVGEYEIIISDINLTNIESYDVIYVNGKMTVINAKDETTENDNQNSEQQNTDKPSTNKPSDNTSNQTMNKPNNNQSAYQTVKDNIINKVVSSNKKQDIDKVDIKDNETNKKDNNIVSNNTSDKNDTISKSDNTNTTDKDNVQNNSKKEKMEDKKSNNMGLIISLVVILIAVVTTIFIIAFNLTKKNYLKK